MIIERSRSSSLDKKKKNKNKNQHHHQPTLNKQTVFNKPKSIEKLIINRYHITNFVSSVLVAVNVLIVCCALEFVFVFVFADDAVDVVAANVDVFDCVVLLAPVVDCAEARVDGTPEAFDKSPAVFWRFGVGSSVR